MNLGNVSAQIGLDSGPFSSGLNQAIAALNSYKQSVQATMTAVDQSIARTAGNLKQLSSLKISIDANGAISSIDKIEVSASDAGRAVRAASGVVFDVNTGAAVGNLDKVNAAASETESNLLRGGCDRHGKFCCYQGEFQLFRKWLSQPERGLSRRKARD